MKNFYFNYVAMAVFQYYLDGNIPQEHEYTILMHEGFINLMRNEVRKSNIPKLFKIINSNNGYKAAIGIDLLKNFSTDVDVILFLKKRWEDADVYQKCHLFWRIVDDPNLEDKWHDELFNFALENWEVFKKVQKLFWRSSDEVIPGVQRKLLGSEYTLSKKWTNLLRLPELANNQFYAKAIIENCLNSFDDRFRLYGTEILKRFYSSKNLKTNIEWHILSDTDKTFGIKFVAKAVKEFFLKGHYPTREETEKLIKRPLIEELRNDLREKDITQIVQIISNNNDYKAALAVSMLRRFSTKNQVMELLKEKWEKADDYLKCHLFWRILDDPRLSEEWHEKLFNFIMNNWEIFKKTQRLFWSEKKSILEQVIQRLADKSFPPSKSWAYLSCLPEVVEDKNTIKFIISFYVDAENQFVKKVANYLLQRFF